MEDRPGNIKVAKKAAMLLLSGATYNSAAVAFPAIATAPTATSATTGVATIDVGTHNLLDVIFAGTTTANQVFNYMAVGWLPAKSSVSQAYFPLKLAEGVVTLGAKALGTAGAFIESSTALIADTITETTACPYSQVWSAADDTAAHLLLDVSLFHHVTILVSRKDCTAATMTVLAAIGDSVGGIVRFDPDIALGAVTVTSGAITVSGTVAESVAAKTPTVLTQTVSAAGTGVALVATATPARALWLTAKKATGVNVGNVYVGTSAVDKTTDQQTVLEPGDYWQLPIPAGTTVDLNLIYVDAANNNDGVTGGYIPA